MICTKKLLHMGNTVINSYNNYAAVTSFLSDIENVRFWLYENYVSIFYLEPYKTYLFDELKPMVFCCPWLNAKVLTKTNIKTGCDDSILNFIVNSINQDMYVELTVNRYFIPIANEYKTRHYDHSLFIYGYDLNDKLIYAYDNIRHGKFILFESTFDDIKNAYAVVDNPYILLLTKKSNVNYVFNVAKMKQNINNYIYSAPTPKESYYNNDTNIYGVDAVKYFISSMGNNLPYLDIRFFIYIGSIIN